MDYQEAIDFLFNSFAMFQRQGATAYKPGLDTTRRLDEAFGNPSKRLRTVHVAGTNGKGSVTHSLAAVAQSAGICTGLFTSPHLIDFRERIRCNGQMISEDAVVDFVNRYQNMNKDGSLGRPSFFELTTIMAFEWFASQGAELCIIETGLGGRLDSTNILENPEVSVITNISWDHVALLGDTLGKIASEKAGIIKPGVPVVLGDGSVEEVRDVIVCKASEAGSPLIIASDMEPWTSVKRNRDVVEYHSTPFGDLACDLTGACQPQNMATVLYTLYILRQNGWNIADESIARGLRDVTGLTGLAGRWMRLGDSPETIADTAHNTGGWQYIIDTLQQYGGTVHMVVGFVNDKDVSGILKMIKSLPDCRLYLTKASVERALAVDSLAERAGQQGLSGETFGNVAAAYEAALRAARMQTEQGGKAMVYVGGSTFVVADLLAVSRGLR